MSYQGYEDDELTPRFGKRKGWDFPFWKGLTGGDGYLLRSDMNQDNWYTQTEYVQKQKQQGQVRQEQLLNQLWARKFWEYLSSGNRREQESQGGTSYFPTGKVASPAKPPVPQKQNKTNARANPPQQKKAGAAQYVAAQRAQTQKSTSQTMVNPQQMSRYQGPGAVTGTRKAGPKNINKRRYSMPRYGGRK